MLRSPHHRYGRILAVIAAPVLVLFGFTVPALAAAASVTDGAFTYSTGWNTVTGSQHEHWTATNGKTADLAFTIASGGGTLSLRGVRGSGNRTVSVAIDGGTATNVSEAGALAYDHTMWTSSPLTAGIHTLHVVVVAHDGSITGASTSNGCFDGSCGGGGSNTTPTAAFTASTLTVTFDASASSDPDGTVTGYSWNFGDGQTGTGVTTSHTYNVAGTYTVAMTATDNTGGTTTTSKDVTVGTVSTSTAGTTGGGGNPTGPWSLRYDQQWNTAAALGNFETVYPGISNYDGATDTSGAGTYNNNQTLSVANGILDENLHTVGSTHYVSALTVDNSQTYGRYEVRFRSDVSTSYKVAWLLWPVSENWNEGEIDFPEAGLGTRSPGSLTTSPATRHRTPGRSTHSSRLPPGTPPRSSGSRAR